MSVPKLRFKEFKGKWEVKPLGQVTNINPKSSKLPDSFIYIDLESVKNGCLLFENRIDLKTAPSRAQRLLQKNDILYQTVRPYQRNNLLFNQDGDYVASTGYAQIRCKQSANFLFQLLYSDNFVNDVLLRCTGTSYPAIDSSSLSEIQITIPTIQEQTKIADFLMVVDEKIAQLTQKCELLARYKKGVMQQIFSRELRFKDDDGSNFPDWEEKRLDDIADIKGGKRLPKGVSLQIKKNQFPYITVSDMYQGSVDTKNIKYVPSNVVNIIKNYKISRKDIFISVAGTLGIVGIIPEELEGANLTENANKITNLKCDQQYLFQYLLSEKLANLIENVSTVGAQPKLAIYALNSFQVDLPSVEEQIKIANFLTSIDEKITEAQTYLDTVKQYKQGLLQQMFV